MEHLGYKNAISEYKYLFPDKTEKQNKNLKHYIYTTIYFR